VFAAPNVVLIEPVPAAEDELALFHTPEYVNVVKALSRGEPGIPGWKYGFGPGDNPVFEGMFENGCISVGSTLGAAKLLAENKCDGAFSLAGGLHHGGPDFVSGFCVFNDAAVAIQWLVNHDFRVAYVDIDVHHGDGVQEAFYESDKVLTISFHQDGRTLFPGTGYVDEIGRGIGAGYSINVPLPAFTDDAAYLWAFEEIVPASLDQFQADIVVTQLGVDTHYKDPLAQMMLSTSAHEALYKLLDQHSPRWLALGGGGYALDVVPRSWALAFERMSGQRLPDELPPNYVEQFGGQWLRDREAAENDEPTRDWVMSQVNEIVEQVKKIHAAFDSFGK
jgi:acetoin utilization protein AcuC